MTMLKVVCAAMARWFCYSHAKYTMETPAKTRARVVPLPVRPRVPRRLEFSIMIEWENALLSELARSHRMLESLAAQIAALDARRFALCQIVFLYDRDSAQRP